MIKKKCCAAVLKPMKHINKYEPEKCAVIEEEYTNAKGILKKRARLYMRCTMTARNDGIYCTSHYKKALNSDVLKYLTLVEESRKSGNLQRSEGAQKAVLTTVSMQQPLEVKLSVDSKMKIVEKLVESQENLEKIDIKNKEKQEYTFCNMRVLDFMLLHNKKEIDPLIIPEDIKISCEIKKLVPLRFREESRKKSTTLYLDPDSNKKYVFDKKGKYKGILQKVEYEKAPIFHDNFRCSVLRSLQHEKANLYKCVVSKRVFFKNEDGQFVSIGNLRDGKICYSSF